MNSTVGQKWKQKQKSKDLVSFNQNWTRMGFDTVHGLEKSLKKLIKKTFSISSIDKKINSIWNKEKSMIK